MDYQTSPKFLALNTSFITQSYECVWYRDFANQNREKYLVWKKKKKIRF
jgi:hypothetical protein